jgi:hypothetical protein
MDKYELRSTIVAGAWDDDLDYLSQAIRDRKAIQSKTKFYELAPGDRVRLQNLRPQYLVGATATVVDRKQTKLTVTIDRDWLDMHPKAKGKWSGIISANPSMLERI